VTASVVTAPFFVSSSDQGRKSSGAQRPSGIAPYVN